MLMKAQRCCCSSSSSLQQRIESQQRHIDVLRSAKEDAVLSARELHRANERIRAQLSCLAEKLSSSKQLTQVTWGNASIFVAFFFFFWAVCSGLGVQQQQQQRVLCPYHA